MPKVPFLGLLEPPLTPQPGTAPGTPLALAPESGKERTGGRAHSGLLRSGGVCPETVCGVWSGEVQASASGSWAQGTYLSEG